ncbi:MAG: AmmeMemoRadiSam system protein B, partial [Candidatus Cloacimonetes bacterium]|nr:AmmeMemoRadiSam system protein B [Candidatus Cloacimonadota bacterium]
PHAGYVYSGKCAAYGFQRISHLAIDSFIIIHPSHRANSFGFSVSPFTSYQTPLGVLTIDKDIAGSLEVSGAEQIDPWYHQNEHSMEVQLPFIQYFYPETKICPVMMGDQSPASVETLSYALDKVLSAAEKQVMIVISSDLSHYHRAKVAEALDTKVIEHINALDANALMSDLRKGECEACGGAPIAVLLRLAALRNASRVEILNYTHSGHTSGDHSQVVGYLSAALTY